MSRTLYYTVDMALGDVYNSLLVYWGNYGGIIKEQSPGIEESSLVLSRLDYSGKDKRIYLVSLRQMIADSNKTEVRIEIELGENQHFDFLY